MTLTHPEPGFQGHRSFQSSIAQKSRQIYRTMRTKRIFYESGDYTDKIIVYTGWAKKPDCF